MYEEFSVLQDAYLEDSMTIIENKKGISIIRIAATHAVPLCSPQEVKIRIEHILKRNEVFNKAYTTLKERGLLTQFYKAASTIITIEEEKNE